MLGSVRDDGGVMTKTGVASGSVYLASGNVRELHARALAAGATEVMGLTEQDYGSLDFAVQDPEGVLWSVGSYRGAGADCPSLHPRVGAFGPPVGPGGEQGTDRSAQTRDFCADGDHMVAVPVEALAEVRSEERRVGKECRSRWSPYH